MKLIQLKLDTVKTLMKQQEISLNELSRRTGLNVGNLSRVLRGEGKPGRKVIERLLSYFQLPFEALCEYREDSANETEDTLKEAN